MQTQILDGEYWWGAIVTAADHMPFSKDTDLELDMYGGTVTNDQAAPLLLSSKGRYIWCDRPFNARFKGGVITCTERGGAEIELADGFENLKGAYLAACKKHFPFGKLPHELFFRLPQYNTWMALGTAQTTDNVLHYARGIVENGLKPGVLMIDGGWQETYGVFEFNRRLVPDPKYLIDKLHALGFKVMIWTSPFIACAGDRYKEMRDKGYLVRNADGTSGIRKWWSGYSAELDLTNPKAVEWFTSKLDFLMERYGVDGYKFDAGDVEFYLDDDDITVPCYAREQTTAFNALCEKYPFNEYRAAWNCGGKPVVARLHDKNHSWDDYGLNTLIKHTITQGLLGYAYCCPDMVGGGQIGTMGDFDSELYIRWAQTNALMAMMQISAEPWLMLNRDDFEKVKQILVMREELGDYIYDLARHAAKTGEPIVRHMAYEFPNECFETVNDQYMLGSEILAAPIMTKNTFSRSVKLPEGKWITNLGQSFDGGKTIQVDMPLDKLVYFKKA